jgi:hypothetical protein
MSYGTPPSLAEAYQTQNAAAQVNEAQTRIAAILQCLAVLFDDAAEQASFLTSAATINV